MKEQPRRLLSVAALLLVVGCSSGPSAPDAGSYVERIAAQRAEKERFFRESTDSKNPFKNVSDSRKQELLPLSYYPIDPEFSIPASLRIAEEQPVFEVPTSTGTMRKMRQVGVLEFTLKGQPLSLGALVEADAKDLSRLFVPFSDLTTGTETYEAGRYLDIDRSPTGIYVIDFNDAYSPYCAYNATYECPYPPPSNRLKVAITAGERVKSPPRTPPPSGQTS